MAWQGEVRLGRDELLRLLTNNLRLVHGRAGNGKEWQGWAGRGWVGIGFGGLPNNNPPLNHNKGE